MSQFLKVFAKDESGAAAVEYGLIVAVLSLVVIGGAVVLGAATNGILQSVAGTVAAPGA